MEILKYINENIAWTFEYIQRPEFDERDFDEFIKKVEDSKWQADEVIQLPSSFALDPITIQDYTRPNRNYTVYSENALRNANMSAVSISHAISQSIREAAEPYVGRRNNEETRQEILTSIATRLEQPIKYITAEIKFPNSD